MVNVVVGMSPETHFYRMSFRRINDRIRAAFLFLGIVCLSPYIRFVWGRKSAPFDKLGPF